MAGLMDALQPVNVNAPTATVLSPLELGLLGAAAGAGQYAGASRLPITTGQVIGGLAGGFGRGYMGGLMAQQQAQQNQAAALQNQLQGMNVQGFRRWLGLGNPNNAANSTTGPVTDRQERAYAPGYDNTRGTDAAPSASSALPMAFKGAPLPSAASATTNTGYTLPATASASPYGTQPPPLFGVPELGAQIRALMSFPAGQPMAEKLIGLLPHTQPGTYLAADGSLQMLPNAANVARTQNYATESGKQAADLNYAGPEAWAKMWPQLYEAQNRPYALRGPGSSLIEGGNVIAQNPMAVHGVDAAGHPFETFVRPPIYAPGAATQRPPLGTSTTLYRHLAPAAASLLTGGSQAAGAPQGGLMGGPLTIDGHPNSVAFRDYQGALPVAASPQGNGAVTGGLMAGSSSPQSTSGPNITYGPDGTPIIQTGLSPLEESSAKERGDKLEAYGEDLQNNAQSAVNSNFIIDQMRRESQTWQQGKFANVKNDALSYVQSVAKSWGISPQGLDQRVADFQAFRKNSMQLVQQAVRKISSRAAVQEFKMIQDALPNPDMTHGGFDQVANEFQAINDYDIASQRAATAWRNGHAGTLAGFQSYWNDTVTPAAFLVNRMSTPDFETMAANLQKTPEGRAQLGRLRSEISTAQKLNLFFEAQ